MAQQEKKRRPSASLTDLLAEHTRVAEQERQQMEAQLRAREEEERRAREEEEHKQKELLRQRLDEEKRRAEERFQRQQEREAPSRPAPVVAAPTAAPAPAPAPPSRLRLVLAVALTAIVMAGLAVGAWSLFLTDTRADRSVLRRTGAGMMAHASLAADQQQARHAAAQNATRQASALVELEKQLVSARADIVRLESEMTEAQKQAAADRKRAEDAAAAAGAASGSPAAASKPKRPPRPPGIVFRPGALTGGDVR